MASYRSQRNIPTRPDDRSSSQRTTSTRLPVRSPTPSSSRTDVPAPSSKLSTKGPGKDSMRTQESQTTTTKAKVTSKKERGADGTRRGVIRPSTTNAAQARGALQSSAQSSRLEPPPVPRTPSLVSGSSVSTNDSPRSARSGILRKKQSIIGQHVARSRGQMASSASYGANASDHGGYQDPFPEAVLGITMPPPSGPLFRKATDSGHDTSLDFGFDAPHRLATDDLPPPPPLQYSAISGSPSTRYSDSPGPFSHTSTPTSMSSYSPGLALSMNGTPRSCQVRPTSSNPPVSRQNTDESIVSAGQAGADAMRDPASSSSGSTVRDGEDEGHKGTRRRSRLPGPSPSQATAMPQGASASSTSTRANLRQSVVEPRTQQQRPAQYPPELAHLADHQPAQSTRKPRPVRPSREGTADLSALREPSLVIQSNLRSLSANSTGGLSSPDQAAAPNTAHTRNRLAKPSRIPSRNPSPSPSGLSAATSRAFSSRGPTPDIPSDGESKLGKGPSPSPSKFSRFGIFRRAKTEPTAVPTEKKPRKGPVAGTGHEAYGRFARRGRSGSTASGAGSVGRSGSADSYAGSYARPAASRKSSVSSKGESDVDEFFLDRLNPVVIRGEGRSLDSGRSASSFDSTDDGRSQASATSVTSTVNQGKPRPTLLPSALPHSTHRGSPLNNTPEEAVKYGIEGPSLAERRSFRRSQLFDKEKKTLKIPNKIDTSVPPALSSIDSSLADQSSIPDTGNTLAEGKEGFWLRPKKAQAQPKPSRKPEANPRKKWNFFQRSQTPKKQENPPNAVEVVEQPAPSRAVAHYAMVDPASQVDPDEIQRIMQEAEQTGDDSDLANLSRPPSMLGQASVAFKEREPSMLLPSPPKISAEFYQQQWQQAPGPNINRLLSHQESTASSNTEAAASSVNHPAPAVGDSTLSVDADNPVPRPSRLAQVGRIPQVVSNREQSRQPPEQSFSRPFAQDHPAPQSPRLGNAQAGNATAPSATRPPYDRSISQESAIKSALNHVTGPAWPVCAPSSQEFLGFSPQHNSGMSYSSSSGTSYRPITTAVIPPPNAPASEDEVWKEYDDLIDEVLSPGKTHRLSKMLADRTGNETMKLTKSTPNLVPGPFSAGGPLENQKEDSDAALMNFDWLEPPPQVLSTFRSNGTLDTTGTVSNLIAGYGDRNLSFEALPSAPNGPDLTTKDSATTFRSSVATSIQSDADSDSTPPCNEPSQTKPSPNRYRDTMLMEMAEEQNDGLESMANLRFDALMTSKWLSFGRVLFSPAHSELKDRAEDRVLVLDGLGKDWSYYCALTYPGATVYNLGPNPSDSPPASQAAAFATLPNHRHVHHPDPAHPYPFPRGFFHAVVFRFPIAASEASYRFAISECKRVLRPGGYLEISALDLDMMNMGNRARRALRGLKVRMQVSDPNVSLKPVSDNIQRLLGRRGFENLNRCMVGVPAAGRIPSSRDNSLDVDRKSVNFSDLLNGSAAAKGANGDGGSSSGNNNNKSANDDECITQMVAKVGRWWYSRCYETGVLAAGDLSQSVWADEALLRECEKWQTSFRMLLCYAQKPTITPRRTISV